MTEVDKMAGAVDPRSLIDQLRRELVALDESGEDTEAVTDDEEQWADMHLRDERLPAPSLVVAAVDDLIPRYQPSPSGRAGMIAAAGLVLAQRSRFTGLLPVLLRAEREARELPAATIAAIVDLSVEELQELESGESEINLQFPVERVARWIGAIPVDRELALAALRRSLRVGWTGELAVAAGVTEAPPSNVEEYVEQVAAALDAAAGGRS